jgi:hypothetical protein
MREDDDRRAGWEAGLRKKLEGLSVGLLKGLVRQNRIPCSNLARRRKSEIIQILIEHTENRRAAHSGSDLEAA